MLEDTPPRAATVRVKAVTVDVTRESIDQAKPLDSSHCMIADAIKAARPDVNQVGVDLATIRFTEPDTGRRLVYLTPESAQTALLAFDQGFLPPPFTFVLRKPVQIVNARTYNKKRSRKTLGVASATITDDKGSKSSHSEGNGAIPVKIGGTLIPNGTLSNRRGRVRGFGMRQTHPGVGSKVVPAPESGPEAWKVVPDTEDNVTHD